ncbi:MAG: restriction endonuclease subunit S [Prevotella sp.]|nr:restriction endonuclease subunit S [Prevotella sp.]
MKEGWEYKRLGDITEIKGGKRLPKGVKLLTTPTEHPYIRVADFNDLGTVDTDDIHYISDSVYEQIKRYIIKKEDVYISIAGTIGKSGIIPDYLDGANLTENACRLILSSNVCQRYVYYFTISPSFIKQIDERTKKSAQPKLALTRLSDVIITYPTIKEQQSIVDYLDSAFAKIDAMKANAEKALNEAKALFQASLKEMLEPKEGWGEKTLKDVSVIYGNYGLSVPSTEFNGVRYLRITDITEWGDLNDEKVSAKLDEEKEQELLEEGDILFARTGATVGKTLMYKEAFGKCLFAGYLIRYRLNKEIILPKFVFYITHSDNYYKWVLENQKAAAQPNISAKLYNEYILSYPSLSEQQSIVASLDSLKSKVDRLQENYDKISQECDALKQSILRQVFE